MQELLFCPFPCLMLRAFYHEFTIFTIFCVTNFKLGKTAECSLEYENNFLYTKNVFDKNDELL
jgi:hypothetical protein